MNVSDPAKQPAKEADSTLAELDHVQQAVPSKQAQHASDVSPKLAKRVQLVLLAHLQAR